MIGHAHVQPAAGFWGLAVLWFCMMAAMMMPTVWPWLRLYHRFAAPGRAASTLVVSAPFAGGYFAAWIAYSIAAAAVQTPMSIRAGVHGQPLGALVLIAAGVYQFSALKRSCLTHCRNPLTYFLARWRSGPSGGFVMGARHGLFCVGCCWALMATMLAVGTASLWWMVALTAATFVEQVAVGGHRLRRPLGAALIAWGVGAFW